MEQFGIQLSVSTSTSDGLVLLPLDRLNVNVNGFVDDDEKEIFGDAVDHEKKGILYAADYYDEKEIFYAADYYDEKEIFYGAAYYDEKELFYDAKSLLTAGYGHGAIFPGF
jgi:hypothetical protein